MSKIRGTHTSPGIYTQLTNIVRPNAINKNRKSLKYNTIIITNGGNIPPKPTPQIPYVIFTAQEDNSSIGLSTLSRNQSLWYSDSSDFATSHNFNIETGNIILNNGESVYIRGVLSTDNEEFNYTRFKMSGKITASGNCNALWNYEDLNAPLKQYCGHCMFQNCQSLTTAPELPVTVLTEGCYDSMFYGCTSLNSAPKLPATTLAESCYSAMFYGCTSLTEVPDELPATTLADWCYSNMFRGCTLITTTPVLPATILAEHCYFYMFAECTSLTEVPDELPATTLANSCYELMFYGCESLTEAPELPATILKKECYRQMFQGCQLLTTAPELPATVLTEGCYDSMFYGCTSLSSIKCLATDITAYRCTLSWVYGVSSTGTFVKHPDMNDWTLDSVDGVPIGWTVEDAILTE